jgi:hypothetical protein
MKASIKLHFIVVVLFSSADLRARVESNTPFCYKKPSIQQLYGVYKIVLGTAMIASCSYSIVASSNTNLDYAAKKNFTSPYYTMLSMLMGGHMVYFGICDAINKPSSSPFLKIQKHLVDSFISMNSLLFIINGLSFLKEKAQHIF